MKTFLLITGFLIFGLTSAQNSINYKAIIKDSNGNVLDTETISVRFGIIDESTSTTVYREEFASVETNQNGLIILEIGSGSASIGTYNAINWNSGNNYMLKVEVDLQDGSGYVDMGNSPFNAVPFAKVASTIAKIPSRTLEVAGDGLQRLRINSENGITTSLELMRTGAFTDWRIENSSTWLDFLISEDDFSSSEYKFSFHKDGRLGINNSNPVEELDVTGTIRSSDLAGSGTRNLVADAQGNLIVDNQTKFISINPVAFHAKTPIGVEVATTVITGNALSGQSGDKLFQTNLNIPHGATLTGVWVHYVDNSAASNMTFQMERRPVNNNTFVLVVDGASSGSSSAHRVYTVSPLGFTNIDNSRYTYIMKVRSTNWQNQMYVTGIVISYID
ncbi:hypothetical protein [Psychroserpens sp. Hel_I_66]|uniref:hypothetical protein n=1 Tax=Psychroserpens sp. Hel_I_66 TaxID=1250004 RepID=UPI000647E838|nr:hypothetical protein [Psychroserpens sp. Hel_I_66]